MSTLWCTTRILFVFVSALVMPALAAGAQTGHAHSARPECYYGEGHGMMGRDQYTCEHGVLIQRSYYALRKPEFRNRVETFRPSPQAWSRFWKSVDAAGVWKWRRYYNAKVELTDGPGWVIELHHEHRAVKSQGYNAFPSGFSVFARALERLKDDARKHPARSRRISISTWSSFPLSYDCHSSGYGHIAFEKHAVCELTVPNGIA